jgi:hypothetical protein
MVIRFIHLLLDNIQNKRLASLQAFVYMVGPVGLETKTFVDSVPFTSAGQTFYRDSDLKGFALRVDYDR